MNTGMRRTALSEINLDDISFVDRKLTVIDKRHTEQIYDITDEIEDAIMKWLKKREKLLNGVKTDALFISTQRQRITPKSIERIVKKYSKDALGFEISPHKLRAAFITNYYEASGHDLDATCKAVGHSDVSTTYRYITRKNNARTEAINFMSKTLKN
jgi:site-specific recombinase XerD